MMWLDAAASAVQDKDLISLGGEDISIVVLNVCSWFCYAALGHVILSCAKLANSDVMAICIFTHDTSVIG